MEELTEAFVIVTIVKSINVLCKAGTEAFQAVEQKVLKTEALFLAASI